MEQYIDHISQRAYDQLKAQLSYLKGERRTEIANALAEARSHGDLSENAEYDEARNEQARLEAEIAKLEYTLEHSQVVEVSSTEVVSNGCGVVLRRHKFNDDPEIIETLQIVGRSQANYKKHKVADDSPIGKVVLGKRVNDQFIVEAPVGILTFTVLEITDGSEFEDENKDI